MSVGPLSEAEFRAYQEEIKRRESQGSGGYLAVNSLGYSGAYQMGAAALVDTGLVDRNAYIAATESGRFNQREFLENPNNWTISGGQQEFLNDRQLQDDAFRNYTSQNLRTLERIGAIKEGDRENPTRVAGLLGVSHLLGPGEAKKLANGQTTTTDANGTTAFEYYKLGSDAVRSAPPLPPPPPPPVSLDAKPRDPNVLDPDDFDTDAEGGTISAEDRARIRSASTDTDKANRAGEMAQGRNAAKNAGNAAENKPSNFAQEAANEYAGGNLRGEFDTTISNPVIKAGEPSSANIFGSGGNIEINPSVNVLSNFSSYAYNISLYMLSPKEYVKLLREPRSVSQIPKYLIARSGGVGSEAASEFKEEFYIDDLSISNVAASPTTMAANTNATDISFVITEPRGVTLIERLREQARTTLENEIDFIQAPYLLQITFKGYDELGKPVSEIVKPKYIPIKITDFKFGVENTGAVYKIAAVPFNHDVFKSIEQTIPITIQVKASTVKDVFESSGSLIETEEVQDTSVDAVEGDTVPREVKTNIESLTAAMNKFYQSLTKDKDVVENNNPNQKKRVPSTDELASEISFQFATSIEKAKLVQANFDAMNTPSETNQLLKNYGAAVKKKVNLDSKTQMFRINNGTGIVNLINYIIVGSSYVERNIIDDASGKTEVIKDRPIDWFKIKPKIIDTIGWDKKRGMYKFKVRYDVVEQKLFYSDFPWVAPSKPKGNGVHKVYDYIFTGQNTEVLDFKLNFDSAYYQATQLGSGIPKADKTPNSSLGNSLQKVVTQSTVGNNVSSDTTVKNKRAKDLFSVLMNDGTDLIDLGLTIMGDPSFIPTGDSFWQDQELRGRIYDSAFLPDDTINYDISPPFIQVNLKTPIEYDDYTGLLNPNQSGKYKTSEFAGVYQLTEIESDFSGGVFTQKLKGFRTHLQPITQTNGVSRAGLAAPEQRATDDEAKTIERRNMTKTTETPLPKKDSAVVVQPSQLVGDETDEDLPNNTNTNATAQRIANEFAGGNVQGGEFGTTLPNAGTVDPNEALISETQQNRIPPGASFSGLTIQDDAAA